jgi:hypothetical protein
MPYIYLAGVPDEPLAVSFDLPRPFDHRACAGALVRAPEGTLH